MKTRRYTRTLRETICKPEFNKIVIKAPPVAGKCDPFDWSSGVIQCLTSIINFSIVSFIIAKDLNITLFCATISAVGTFLSSVLTHLIKKHNTERLNLREENSYIEYLDSIQSKVEERIKELNDYYKSNYPDISDCIEIVKNVTNQLWDRQPKNADFLLIKIGVTSSKELEIIVPECEENAEYCRKINLIKRKEIAESIPELISLKGVIGVVGEDKYVNSVRDNILIDLFTHHVYSDVKVIYLDKHHYNVQLAKCEYANSFSERQCLVASTDKDIESVTEWLKNILKNRKASLLTGGESSVPFPYYIMFVAEDILTEEDKSLFCHYSREKIAFSIVYLCKYIDQLPKSTDITIDCKPEKLLIHNNIDNPSQCKYITLSESSFNTFLYYINQIQSVEGISKSIFHLPHSISIYMAYQIKKANDLKIVDIWNRNENSATLKIPIGIDEYNKKVVLDINAKADGPHGLITGTTGSGKSELIRTIVLSMAINYSPRRINFILIDFKGGILANSLRGLPHIKNIITNLDKSIENEIGSLRAELIRRQKLLVYNGANNMTDYNKKHPESKLPAILIVIDEFAELKCQYPEFMNDILSISRVGRALGINLLLSTQSASSMVSDQIYSNSNYRICFRVNSPAESLDMIKSPLASNIQYPGRAFIQVADSSPRLFQAYWCEEYDQDGAITDTQCNRLIKCIKNSSK